METISDIQKLTSFLNKEEIDCHSDSNSVDSNELLEDCNRLEIIQKNDEQRDTNIDDAPNENYDSTDIFMDEDTKNIISKCKNPLLRDALIANVKKRNVLHKLVNNLEAYIVNLNKIEEGTKINSPPGSEPFKQFSKIKKRLGAPYFKDNRLFPCPLNEDYKKMKQNKHEIITDNKPIRSWQPEDKLKLAKGVYSDICAKHLESINKKITSLKSKNVKINISNSEELKRFEYEKGVFSNQKIIQSVAAGWNLYAVKNDRILYKKQHEADRNLEKKMLIMKTINAWQGRIDWLKISIEDFKSKRSDTECKSMWCNYLNPKINKEPWKQGDDLKLIEIVKKYNYQDWNRIANELDIGKSAFQCCIHFHSKLCEKFNKDMWSSEEDQLLKNTIEFCRLGDYIPWAKVAYYFRNRTKRQIYSHYMSSVLPVKKGSFSLEEDVLLLTVWQLNDGDLTKVKPYFPNRSSQQLRDRLKSLSTHNSDPWTLEEDVQIIQFVEQYGHKNWSKVNLRRSSGCIRHRYNTLKKWFEQNPNDKLENVPRRQKKSRKYLRNRQATLQSTIDRLIREVQAKKRNQKLILTISHIERLLNIKPKRKCIVPIVRKTNRRQRMTIDKTLSNFLKSSHRSISRQRQHISNEVFSDTADRINILLEIFGAKLALPNLQDINDHPLLDDADKVILTEIIINKENAIASSSSNQTNNVVVQPSMQITPCLIPPSPETLIGFRTLLLHIPVLREHAKYNYENYNLFVRNRPYRYAAKSLQYTTNKVNRYLENIDREIAEDIINNREIFYKRLKMLFYWPNLLSKEIPKNEDIFDIESTENITVTEQEPRRRGRPSKVNHVKVSLMNKARLEKYKLAASTSTSSLQNNQPIQENSISLIRTPGTALATCGRKKRKLDT